MSKYSVTIEEIIYSMTFNTHGTLSSKIDTTCPLIFNFTYPIWDNAYKPILERKILLHYIKHEIGLETFALWQLFLEEKLNRIMPVYNKQYLSTIIDYDISKSYINNSSETNNKHNIETHNQTETTHSNSIGSNDATNNATNSNSVTLTNSNIKTDYNLPQSQNGGAIDYASYLVNIADSGTNTNNGVSTIENNTDTTLIEDNTRTNANNIDIQNIETHIKIDSGNNIPISDLIIKYRDTIINIDEMIINELSDLFMNLY